MDELIPVLEETNRLLSQHFQNNTSEWVSIIISLVALFCAFYVPKRIASRQDKIALFGKRFAAYSDLLKLKSFADILRYEGLSFNAEKIDATGDELEDEITIRVHATVLHFGTIFNYLPDDLGGVDTIQTTGSVIKSIELSVNALPLLYSKELGQEIDSAHKEITEIFESLMDFMTDIVLVNRPINDNNRIDFITRVGSFLSRYSKVFEAGMSL